MAGNCREDIVRATLILHSWCRSQLVGGGGCGACRYSVGIVLDRHSQLEVEYPPNDLHVGHRQQQVVSKEQCRYVSGYEWGKIMMSRVNQPQQHSAICSHDSEDTGTGSLVAVQHEPSGTADWG
jgi:hypothetical protein